MESDCCSPIISARETACIRRLTLLPICHVLCTIKLQPPWSAAGLIRCNHGWILERKTVERTLGRAPIPFRLRFGFVIFLEAIAAFGAATHAIKTFA